MAFDKKAYNREYYKTHKSLWDKYREGGSSSGNTTYTTASPLYTQKGSAINSARRGVQSQLANRRYGTYGNAIAKSEADKKRREHAVRSSNEAIERRKRSEEAKDRYKGISKAMARKKHYENYRDTMFSGGLAEYRKVRDSDYNFRPAGYGISMDERNTFDMKSKGLGAYKSKKKKNILQRAADSYTSAWKSGAKDISEKAQKARKKAAKFIKNLFG